jgi:uncharacterized protein YbbK (DUF523 family)
VALSKRPRLGISSCLLGQAVRWDGGHRRDDFLARTLARRVEWVPVCPELEIGMGVPRPPVRLEGDIAAPRMIASDDGRDWTDAMRAFARARVQALRPLQLCGYVFKENSPSCGVARVKVHAPDGGVERSGRGLFAAVLMEEMPLLPVEDEGRLADPRRRDVFLTRVFACWRWRKLMDKKPTPRDLSRFHARSRPVLPRGHVRRLDNIVANAQERKWSEVLEEYGRLYAAAFQGRSRSK